MAGTVHLIDPARRPRRHRRILAIAWPGVTILALVILFAIYAFMDAGLQATRAFSSRSGGRGRDR